MFQDFQISLTINIELNKDPEKYETFVNNSCKISSEAQKNHTFDKIRLLAYMCEWLVSNYLITHFKLNNIKILH